MNPLALARWAIAAAAYVALAGALHAIPLPWPMAVGNAALLAGLMWGHATCYALWQPFAPGRILANELLTRLWFAAYAVLIAGLLGRPIVVVGEFGVGFALGAWALHGRGVRQGYDVAENVAFLGLFLASLAGLLAVA